MRIAPETRFVGIDVSKDDLFAAISDDDDVLRFANTAAGIAEAAVWLTGLDAPVVVAFEATGGFERALWEALVEADVDARQLNPREVRAWRQSRGRQAKTDPIDARAIAGLLASRPDAGRRLPEQRRREINALLAKRRQLVDARKILLCQRRQHHHPVALDMDEAQIELLKTQIDRLNALIEDAIAEEPQLARDAQLLRSIPGVGPVISATLLADMPELGTIAGGSAAALAGLAPFADDSGKHHGPRRIRHGRRHIRSLLFQAALAACRCNRDLALFAQRLKERGKPHKQVICAVARKLIELANSILRRQTPWLPVPA